LGPGPQVANVLIYQQGRIGTRNLCALEKSINEYDTFKYYVVGLKMAEVDYTVKLAIGVKNGYTYYGFTLRLGAQRFLALLRPLNFGGLQTGCSEYPKGHKRHFCIPVILPYQPFLTIYY
jgi:hypothetical protein